MRKTYRRALHVRQGLDWAEIQQGGSGKIGRRTDFRDRCAEVLPICKGEHPVNKHMQPLANSSRHVHFEVDAFALIGQTLAMIKTRKIIFTREMITADSFGEACNPISRAAAAAVFRNPLAGRFEVDLSALFEIGAELGQQLAEQVVELLDRPAVSYGKAAIVGIAGDIEHGGAVVHPRLGAPMRAAANGGEAVIASNVKIGSVGTAIDLPLGHKDNPWSFDHFDTMTLCVPDGPRPDEIVMFIAYADGGRPIPRCGSGPIQS